MSAVKQSSLGDGGSAFNMARNGLTRGAEPRSSVPPHCESDCVICKANVPQEQGPGGQQSRDMDS